MAFEALKPEQQSAVLEVLKSHPRFEQDFKIPEKVRDPERYLIGRAADWPDAARSQKEYDRPTWHYQSGAIRMLGDDRNILEFPKQLPRDATLMTQDLHITQAIELCREIVKEKSTAKDARALALCWLAHLIGDVHQPCHSGSLYSKRFPQGDRGASSIPTVQGGNLHALWDGLLGPRFDEGDVKRRIAEAKADKDTWEQSQVFSVKRMDRNEWLLESIACANLCVYTKEVIAAVEGSDSKLEPIDLSKEYLESAGQAARSRACDAAARLAKILAEDVGP
jgi:hypothetical protein